MKIRLLKVLKYQRKGINVLYRKQRIISKFLALVNYNGFFKVI